MSQRLLRIEAQLSRRHSFHIRNANASLDTLDDELSTLREVLVGLIRMHISSSTYAYRSLGAQIAFMQNRLKSLESGMATQTRPTQGDDSSPVA